MSGFFHSHNLVNPDNADAPRPFGIRARLPASDPLTRLIGTDWSKDEWFASREERDQAFDAKCTRHGYYRIGDEVSVIYEKIDS
ncbi:MAG: hypothetical protein AAF385_05800 [Pseudomonadota bacterium]